MLCRRIGPYHVSPLLASRVYCVAVALLLVLSEVFSSNIQEVLPTFSRLARMALTGGAILLLLAKLILFTGYEKPWQVFASALALAYSGVAALYGDDIWFFLAVLSGLAAKDVDLRLVLRVYVSVAAGSLLLVQLLHYATPLVPFHFYCRNWDFGYGHYNGYGARLFGIFMAWAWLRANTLHWFDRLGLTALALYTLLVPGCRGAGLAMLLLLVLFLLRRLLPALFACKAFAVVALLVYPLLAGFSLWAGWLFDPDLPGRTPLLSKFNQLLSGRFEIWHHVFWGNSLTHPAEDGAAAWLHLSDTMPNVRTLLGGFTTDGDMHHAIDNAFLALVMNKGILGAVLLSGCLLLLVYRLCRRRRVTELLLLLTVFAYLFMENKPFMLSANPLFLLLPVLLAPRGAPLPLSEESR